MKRLIAGIIISVVAVTAHAQTWEMNNQSGGKIVLTSRDCYEYPNKGLRSGYAYSKGGKTLSFCWAIIDNKVKALYKNGDEYTYDPMHFQRVSK